MIILLRFLHHFLCGKRKRLYSLNSVQLTAITVVFCLVPSLGKWDLLQPASALTQCIRFGFWVPSNLVRMEVWTLEYLMIFTVVIVVSKAKFNIKQILFQGIQFLNFLLQRVSALRVFGDLEKTVLHETRVSGTVLWSPTHANSPTYTYISQKPW